MNGNNPRPDRTRQLRVILQKLWDYLKKIFLSALGVAAFIGVSFLFTGGFSSKAYSDRLFISGIIVTTIGVFVFITIAGTRRNMGIPTIVKTEEDARKLMDHTQELIEKAEKRYDAGSRVWAIGLACLFLSAVIYFILTIFKI
jgi:sugar phosphate permease